MQYRRDDTEGATYFFTVVVFRREPLLADPEKVDILREAVRTERQRRPFQIDAMVILPDHLHALWTLPPDDADYSIRWRNIKRAFTARIPDDQRPAVFGSRQRQGEQAIWQRRFWEHRIRDETDFAHHVNYIHYNPVKHGLVNRPVDWPYSSIHRAIRQGIMPADWGGDSIDIPDSIGHESVGLPSATQPPSIKKPPPIIRGRWIQRKCWVAKKTATQPTMLSPFAKGGAGGIRLPKTRQPNLRC